MVDDFGIGIEPTWESLYLQSRNMNYDICDPSIRCGADKVGASVFVIEQGRGRVCRVLAYNQNDAERLAKDYMESEKPADAGPSLFDGF